MAPSKKHIIAAGMVMIAGVFGVVSPASATPTESSSAPSTSSSTTSADVQKQIIAKQQQLTEINEEYLDAKLELDNQTAAAEKAAADLVVAEQDLTTAKQEVAEMGAEAYVNGKMSAATLLLAGESPQEFIDKINSQNHVNSYNDERLIALAVAQQQTQDLKVQVDAAYTAAAEAEKTIADKKAYIESELPKLEAQYATLSEQERAVVQEQAVGHLSPQGQAAASSGAAPVETVAPAQGGSAAGMTVVNWAMSQRGKPYIWGSSGPNGYDCSGLTLAAYRQVGISLPHSSSAQRGYGTSVSFSALQPGDLVFAPGHVAIYIGNGTVVHAPTFGSPVRTMPMAYMSFTTARRLV